LHFDRAQPLGVGQDRQLVAAEAGGGEDVQRDEWVGSIAAILAQYAPRRNRMSRFLATPLLLVRSNILMSFSWYGHLKAPHWPLWRAILVRWGIAFFEYCLAVPANRIGYGTFTGQQLKIMQR